MTHNTTLHRDRSATAADTSTRRKPKRRAIKALGVLTGPLLVAVGVAWVLFRQDMADARARLAAQPTQIYKSKYGDIQYRVVERASRLLDFEGRAETTRARILRPDRSPR
jgi:hypothetical protein